jgi:hypothetical protein
MAPEPANFVARHSAKARSYQGKAPPRRREGGKEGGREGGREGEETHEDGV